MKKLIFKIARFLIKLILPIVKFGSVKIEVENAQEEIDKNYQKEEIVSNFNMVKENVNESIDLSVIVPVYNSEKLLKKCMDLSWFLLPRNTAPQTSWSRCRDHAAFAGLVDGSLSAFRPVTGI